MVQMANLGKFRSFSVSPAAPVKMEIEDQLEEEHGPLNKKKRWGSDAGMVAESAPHYSLLEEPSPLGLRLRKSPSLLDLIQMKLSQGYSDLASTGGFESGDRKDFKSNAFSGATDKLKASNFPASVLRIGSWECVSRYEGDLVAKCYYAKHKLVWEVLDGGLKNKIEIQWSDITALKANCTENGPGTLDIVLARQPLFFRETNPQPRKHTLWQATSDFTNGQASICRRHFLQCPQGLLNKHFEKLIQCDPHLNSLSQQPEIILDSPYFEPRSSSVIESQEESKSHVFGDLKDRYGTTISGFQDHISPCTASTSTMNKMTNPFGIIRDNVSRETLSPSSVMDTKKIEENPPASNGTKDWDQIKVPGLRSSMSMTDLMNHIGHCMSGQTTPGNPLLPTDSLLNKSMLEELTQYLLGDSQVTSASDEKSLLSRVNSLCCLIQQKDPATSQTLPIQSNNNDNNNCNVIKSEPSVPLLHVSGGEAEPLSSGMSRKESYGELLLNLPRIASFPQFLFNIAEDSEYQSR